MAGAVMEVGSYRALGRTGVRVSPLCLGCMLFGGKTPEEESRAIVRRFVEAGGNFLDTADVYGQGESERVTGRALAEQSGLRERVVLATKFHGQMGEASERPNARGNSAYHVVRACEDSLRRLGTDRIDLYQVHRPEPGVPIDETLRALDRLVRDGKVLYVGTSTFAAWQLMDAWHVAREFGFARFVCEQPPYNILDRRVERELVPYCLTFGVGMIPWSPLAGGLLTGKYTRSSPEAEGGRYSDPSNAGHPAQARKHEGALAVAEGVSAIAGRLGCTASQLALAWVRDRAGVTAPIIGPRTMEQLEDNLGSSSVVLDDEAGRAVDGLVSPGTHVSSYYEADFGGGCYPAL